MSSAPLSDPDLERRFGGVRRLYGAQAADAFAEARVAVVGIGGVGCWTAEALARSGIGALTLIDLDMVAESNVNRQLHALGDEFGKAKVEVMAERIRAINPRCRVRTVEDFVTADNVAAMLPASLCAVADAIDQAPVKAAMIAHCVRQGTPIATAGAAGGQIDPTLVRHDDLARATQDPLLARVRNLLRREYDFPRAKPPKTAPRFGVPAVFSLEALRYPEADPGAACAAAAGPQGLSCAGFGSSVCVTAAVGLALAARILAFLSQDSSRS